MPIKWPWKKKTELHHSLGDIESGWDGSSGSYYIHGYTLDAKPNGYFFYGYGYYWLPTVTDIGYEDEWGRKVLDTSSDKSIQFFVDYPLNMPTGIGRKHKDEIK